MKASGSIILLLGIGATALGDANRGPSTASFPAEARPRAPVAVAVGSSDALKACAAEWSRALGWGGAVSELPADPG